MDYRSFTHLLSFDRLVASFEEASDALARLDERLRISPVAEAFTLRAHFRDAHAALWRQGEFVQIEDLVLHDANTDARSPTHELVRAHHVLMTRRRIAERKADWALSNSGLYELCGAGTLEAGARQLRDPTSHDDFDNDGAVASVDGDDRADANEFAEIDTLIARTWRVATPQMAKRDDSGLIYDEDWDEAARLTEWCERLEETVDLPPLIAAGLAFCAWEEIEPLQHRTWLGPLLVGAMLRVRNKTRHHLAALHAGLRAAKYRRSRQHDLATQLIAFADATKVMVKADWNEFDRLTLARQILLQKCAGKRKNAKLPQLVELALRSPVISASLVAKELNISHQAATIMIDEVASNLRELTGRNRYRAWALV